MKSIISFINESKFETELSKCNTLEKFICKFQGIKNLNELTQDDFDSYDLGFVWFGDDFADITLSDFIKKVKSYGNSKIEDLEFDNNIVTFTCNGDQFDLDYVDPEY